MTPRILRHGDADIFDLIQGLRDGDPVWFAVLAIIGGCILFFALYEALGGRPFVRSKKERRRARERRQSVLWKYERDD